MLIVKNLFSFYVEFEILLHFILFCRLWNENKDVNMRNEAWNEMDRTYTKKSSEKHFHTKIADRKLSLVRSGKKCKNCGPQFWNCGPQILGWKREFTILKRFSQGSK
jgi:hypothetical protein